MTNMSFPHQMITIGVVVIGTMLTRFLPFILLALRQMMWMSKI
ncbi:hypothetical protein [Vagococcus luciliae]|uniref:Uncharacterized protein n=1 Tax=Vagococcus luciliae TaxID=2920380 RepID=A0ABY5P105_9ENTE|nr:hypothetical protein [Vagococcus luciliae]UUV99442.1 hypothetical protein G314FT_16030 [Vagococcus luciliae]